MPIRPDGVNLTQAQRRKWTELAKLEYLTSRVPADRELIRLGIKDCFRELCERAQLTRLFLEPGPPSYHRWTLEFLSTFEMDLNRGQVTGLQFQLGNQRYQWTLDEFNAVFGFTGEIYKLPYEFRGYMNQFWRKITASKENFSASSSKATLIRNPVLRMLQKACACYPFARKEHSSVHREELFLLWTLLYHKAPLNMGHFMVKHLDRASKRTKGYICVGKVIASIAIHLGMSTEGMQADIGGDEIDLSYLVRAGMIGDSRGWALLWLQKDKKDFPLPNTALTYVSGPENEENWGMNTPAHRALAIRRRGDDDPVQSSSDEYDASDDEMEDVEAEAEQEAEHQPESSHQRAKRTRYPAGTSSGQDDPMRTLIEGMSTMQLSQAQLASNFEQMQQWRQADLGWQADITAQMHSQWDQQQAWQAQQDARWTQQQAWQAEQDMRWGQQEAFMEQQRSNWDAYFANQQAEEQWRNSWPGGPSSG